MQFDSDACMINANNFDHKVRATVLQRLLKLYTRKCCISSLLV